MVIARRFTLVGAEVVAACAHSSFPNSSIFHRCNKSKIYVTFMHHLICLGKVKTPIMRILTS